MTSKPQIVLVLIVFGLAATRVHADSTQVADTLCNWFDSTGVTSAPCKVSEQNRTVEVRLNIGRSDAMRVCLEVGQAMYYGGVIIEEPWNLRMLPSGSGTTPIFECELD